MSPDGVTSGPLQGDIPSGIGVRLLRERRRATARKVSSSLWSPGAEFVEVFGERPGALPDVRFDTGHAGMAGHTVCRHSLPDESLFCRRRLSDSITSSKLLLSPAGASFPGSSGYYGTYEESRQKAPTSVGEQSPL